jgi:hypothetical protein
LTTIPVYASTNLVFACLKDILETSLPDARPHYREYAISIAH